MLYFLMNAHQSLFLSLICKLEVKVNIKNSHNFRNFIYYNKTNFKKHVFNVLDILNFKINCV